MERRLISCIVILCLVTGLWGQEEPKREMRSTWVATVANIDWPKYEHRNNPAAQKEELIRMLEIFRQTNMNAIFLQVRAECDAFYQSSYEPWSRYLTWAQGTDPGYDPLQFAIEEAHKRGIEVHAWMNPYRINASTNDGGDYYDDGHVYREHPEWALEYSSGKKILNPGLPEVMTYIGTVVRDVVANYEVDGVHFDDYFYAYEGTPSSLDDDEYALYGNGMNRDDWRRDNVNRMIDTVYRVIQEEDPTVRFGVSPFGIYKDGVPAGISGLNAYARIYCDPLAWLRAGNLDYLTPQTYWPTGGSQDFETLVNWWADSLYHYGRHLYPGQGTYRLSDSPGEKKSLHGDTLLHEYKHYMDLPGTSGEDLALSHLESSRLKGTGDPVAEWTLGQIGLQIDLIRANRDENGLGSVFFSAKDLDRVEGLKEYLAQNKYTHPALIPEMTWKSGPIPSSPTNLRTEIIDNAYHLTWDHAIQPNERFAIYASDVALPASDIITEPENLQGVTFGTSIALSDLVITESSYMVVTTLSPEGKESVPGEVLQLGSEIPFVDLVSPAESDTLASSALLSWSSTFSDPEYKLQISQNSTFSNVIYASDWVTNTAFNIMDAPLEGETRYYWRVRARDGAEGPYSGYRSFVAGFPEVPAWVSPENLAQNVSTYPAFRWDATSLTENVHIQVSESSSFDPLVTTESFPAGPDQGTLSMELEKDTWYYARISGENTYGESGFSEFVTFKTTSGEIPYVSLTAPDDQVTAASSDRLQWETSASEGTVLYKLQVALDASFSSIMYQSDWIEATHMVIGDLQLEGARTYYWRVRGKSEFGESDYSAHRSFTAGYPTRPDITSPPHLAEGVSAKPTVSWETDGNTDSVYVEFSEEGSYETLVHAERFPVIPASAQLSISLRPYTWYFLRLRAENEYGGSVYSANRYFKTGEPSNVYEDTRYTGVEIYPTVLSEGTIHVSLRGFAGSNTAIQFYDIHGRLVYTRKMHSENSGKVWNTVIEREVFAKPGIYILVASDHQKRCRQRILVL